MLKLRHSPHWVTLSLLLLSLPLAGCGSSNHEIHLLPLDQLPAHIQHADERTQQAYQFAAANPDVLKEIPCYCGCVDMGHKSNYECYISGVAADGTLLYDDHALECGVCIDITHDTMKLYKQGGDPVQINDYIDQAYSRYGPSTGP